MIEHVFGGGLKAQGDDQGMISVRQKPPGRLLWSSQGRHDGHSKSITALVWSPDGRYLASGSADTTVKIWDAVTGAVLQTYTEHSAVVCALAWSPDGSSIVSSADRENPHLWIPCLPPRR
ncbi:WD40 repeat domain-containing protein [Ktedonobacteria bacterium brp13]|nr:WD40 repeat domain-containing protein [Ktedonobacteria bacterium brp13]